MDAKKSAPKSTAPVWSGGSRKKKICGHCKTGDEKRAERGMRLLRTGCMAEVTQVAFIIAIQIL